MENTSKWQVWEDLGDNKTMMLFTVDTKEEAYEAEKRLHKNGVKAFVDFPESKKITKIPKQEDLGFINDMNVMMGLEMN
jgi:hypothetical protein